MSASPNLLENDNDDDDPSAEVEDDDDDDEDPSADINEDEDDDKDPSAMVDEDDELLDNVVEAIIEKTTRSRFWWSHTTECIVDNANSKDEALIRILLEKETWNAGHGQVMKAWQNLLAIVLETVVDGDKIFHGVSEATLKKRYQLYLDVGKKWEMEKEKWNQPENEENKHDLNRSTVQLICGGIEDLWEEFVMRKENEKEKKAEDFSKGSNCKRRC